MLRQKSHKSFWTYQASTPTPANPPPGSPMTDKEWHSLTPGMRREIWRGCVDNEARINAGLKVVATALGVTL